MDLVQNTLLSACVSHRGVCTPPESTVPNNETASCSIDVRGEEERCILGVAQQHLAREEAAAESPWINQRGEAEWRGDKELHCSFRRFLMSKHKNIDKNRTIMRSFWT